jgi:ribonuclease P protein component
MKLKAVNQNREFLRAYKRGKGYVDSLVVMYVIKNRYGFTRFGITSSKKVGNAVKRNRARRVLRQSVRNIGFDMNGGYDIILVARAKTAYVKQQQVEAQLRVLAKQAGLIE